MRSESLFSRDIPGPNFFFSYHYCVQSFRVRTNNKVSARNNKIRDSGSTKPLVPEEWVHYSKTFVCTHAGKYKPRGQDKRKRQESRALECDVQASPHTGDTGFQPIIAIRITTSVKGDIELGASIFVACCHSSSARMAGGEAEARATTAEPLQEKHKPVGRPRLREDGGRTESTGTREAFTNAIKLRAAKRYRSTDNARQTIKEFWPNLHPAEYSNRRKLLSKWKKKVTKLEQACATTKGMLRKRERLVGTGTILSKAAEGEIVDWINDLRQEGVPVSALMLSLKATEVATNYNVQDFHASWSWQKRFKDRHRLSLRSRTRQGQQTPDNLAKVRRDFAAEVSAAMEKLGVTTVYNADQTAAFFEYLPKKTINRKGPKTVWVRCSGKSKERATVMLLGDNHGQKYTPFVVLKAPLSRAKDVNSDAENKRLRRGFGVHVWKTIQKLHESEDLEIYGNPKGWWNHELSVEFLRHHFGDRQDRGTPILLAWDDFSGHWTPDVVACAKELNVRLLKVPAGATSVCQPADISWNAPFKSQMRGMWIAFLRKQLKDHAAEKENPIKMLPPSREVVAKWIAQSWGQLSAATIAHGFKKVDLPWDVEPSSQPDIAAVAHNGRDCNANELIAELAGLHVLDEQIGEIDSDTDIGNDE